MQPASTCCSSICESDSTCILVFMYHPITRANTSWMLGTGSSARLDTSVVTEARCLSSGSTMFGRH